jgi:pyridoxamine 5'-phosphate oxidase
VSETDPIVRFNEALKRAETSEPDVPNAMALATADARGRPSVRMVLLKGADERGFVFYTNYESKKGRELADNPHAALCFHWKSLGEQVRVEGRIERVTAAENDAYFASRPLKSQLAAIASDQSQELESRELLEQRFSELVARYGDEPAPRPETWGGYRLVPERIEFWYHEDDRLHRRVLYERVADGWTTSLLYP